MESKKSIRKENFLDRFLNQYRIKSIMSTILNIESSLKKDEEIIRKVSLEASTVVPLVGSNFRPRIESASQITSFELEECGPCEGQMSRSVSVNLNCSKRPLFYVISESDFEDEYKKKVNYDDPLLLKNHYDGKLKEHLLNESKDNTAEEAFTFNFHTYGRMIAKNIREIGEIKAWHALKYRILPIPKW